MHLSVSTRSLTWLRKIVWGKSRTFLAGKKYSNQTRCSGPWSKFTPLQGWLWVRKASYTFTRNTSHAGIASSRSTLVCLWRWSFLFSAFRRCYCSLAKRPYLEVRPHFFTRNTYLGCTVYKGSKGNLVISHKYLDFFVEDIIARVFGWKTRSQQDLNRDTFFLWFFFEIILFFLETYPQGIATGIKQASKGGREQQACLPACLFACLPACLLPACLPPCLPATCNKGLTGAT